MFKLRTKEKLSTKLKGFLISPIKYEVRVSSGDWSPWFGHYQNQKWGQWDSNSCWCLGGAINPIETQMEWLKANGMFSKEAIDFFVKYGYLDSDGDFSLSERFIEILSKNYDNGGTANQAVQLIQKYGCIPRDMLTYTHERAYSFGFKDAFNADYFNKNAITQEMHSLGLQFLKYVNIAYQTVGNNWTTPDEQILRAGLRQSPLSIGVPVPRETMLWNAEIVQWDGIKRADHEVEMYAMDAKGNIKVFDQYIPNLKTLASGYYLPLVLQIIVNATPTMATNPIKQNSIWNLVWTALFNYFNGVRSKFA